MYNLADRFITYFYFLAIYCNLQIMLLILKFTSNDVNFSWFQTLIPTIGYIFIRNICWLIHIMFLNGDKNK